MNRTVRGRHKLITPDEILEFIRKYHTEKHFAPSKAQIARRFDCSRSNIDHFFKRMVDQLKKYPEYNRYSTQSKEKGAPHVHPTGSY